VSQVIVTNDNLRERRQRTRGQEAKIDRESAMARFRFGDITGRDPVEILIGVALLPVVAFWAFITAISTVALYFMRLLLAVLGKIVGGSRNLITGR
jgi:hypothetical protein